MNQENKLHEILSSIERIQHSQELTKFIIAEIKDFPMLAGSFLRPLRAIAKLADNTERDILSLRIQCIQAVKEVDPCASTHQETANAQAK